MTICLMLKIYGWRSASDNLVQLILLSIHLQLCSLVNFSRTEFVSKQFKKVFPVLSKSFAYLIYNVFVHTLAVELRFAGCLLEAIGSSSQQISFSGSPRSDDQVIV